MSSKWCSVCHEIVSTNSIPSFCCWCGKDLRNEEILPEFTSWDERVALIEKLKNRSESPVIKTDSIGQIKLF